MAVFKCKMCGGALEISESQSTTFCAYCGVQQTLPKLNDDRKASLYDRASHFRRNNEFDKAEAIYEQILNEDSSDSESYWSLVLCRYGIEYVEDPATKKRIPTVNRAQFTSIFNDDNYKLAIKHADENQKAIYEAEAETINEIQKGILEISSNEEPFDVFICYKETDQNGRRTPDSVMATELYRELTRENLKVFFARITLEDKLGTAYEPYIFAALNSAKVMVVLGTRPEHFSAVWVKNEWSRYLSLINESNGKKFIIPALQDMDPYDLPEEFSHLQAQDMSKIGAMQDLVLGVKKLVGHSILDGAPQAAANEAIQSNVSNKTKKKKIVVKVLAISIAAVVIVMISTVTYLLLRDSPIKYDDLEQPKATIKIDAVDSSNVEPTVEDGNNDSSLPTGANTAKAAAEIYYGALIDGDIELAMTVFPQVGRNVMLDYEDGANAPEHEVRSALKTHLYSLLPESFGSGRISDLTVKVYDEIDYAQEVIDNYNSIAPVNETITGMTVVEVALMDSETNEVVEYIEVSSCRIDGKWYVLRDEIRTAWN